MEIKELKGVIKSLYDYGMTDEDILKSMFNMYKDDKLSFDEFSAIIEFVGDGYHISDKFKKLSEKERKKVKWEDFK